MSLSRYLPCETVVVKNLKSDIECWDTLCIIDSQSVAGLSATFTKLKNTDAAFESEVSCWWSDELNCRIVYSPIGELLDYDDVRTFGDAMAKAVERAIKAGAKAPIAVIPECKKFEYTELNTILGALRQLYVPIEMREDVPTKAQRITKLGVYSEYTQKVDDIYKLARIIESSLYIARDIGIGDPERMAPPRAVDYVTEAFPADGPIRMTVITDCKKYPLFAAVDRAASVIDRHRGRIVMLEYDPPNKPVKTLMLVGKGVTYDTGGADIKAGGIMAGMSRDKCGAAAVAGFMQLVAQTRPRDVKICGALCLVRNSVGENCYVADEIITSRAGCRVRVGNTDAEGRMCMADALNEFKTRVENENLPNPHLFTIATLTGHACIAVGEGYSICVDNGPARLDGHAYKLKEMSEKIGDPFEISTLRKEDFAFHGGKCLGDDALQSNNLPSSRTPRGHITPAAFLMLASGLDKNGSNSSKPIKYSHLDIASSAGEYPAMPTGSPILALAKTHLDVV